MLTRGINFESVRGDKVSFIIPWDNNTTNAGSEMIGFVDTVTRHTKRTRIFTVRGLDGNTYRVIVSTRYQIG